MAYIPFPEDFIPYIPDIINWVMSFTPLLSYGSTVLSIRRLKSSNGFSIDICATMLIASILRIFYYINDPFETALLRQCFIMIFIQIILLNTALRYRDENYSSKNLEVYENNWEFLFGKFIEINKNLFIDDINCLINSSDNIINDFLKIFTNLIKRNLSILYLFIISLSCEFIRFFDAHYIRPFKFWQWSNSAKYWKFLIFFIMTMLIIQLVFYKNFSNLGLVFGSCSFLIESLLPLPQILLFKRFKTVENFKTILLLSWLGGDITKISYLFYGTDNVTLIFKLAAFFQMSLNLVITYQFFYYKRFGESISNIGSSDTDIVELENLVSHGDLNNNNINIRHSIESVQLPMHNPKRSATFSIGSVNNEGPINNGTKLNNLLIRNNSLNSVVLPPIYKISSGGTIGSLGTNHSIGGGGSDNSSGKFTEFDLTDQIFQNKEIKNIGNNGIINGGGNKKKVSVRSRSSTINEHESINNIHRNITTMTTANNSNINNDKDNNINGIEERDLTETPDE
ncbi:unnamed protein product [[Candida] boidinii]|nr:hypothetical protein B5S33_g5173 [[Candida] boidinii]GMF52204.1 unnamed protein product [[Candida] boidinii]